MDERAVRLASELVTPRYIAAGAENLHAMSRELRSLLAQRRCPEQGMPSSAVEQLVLQLANMDSNNFAAHIGAGEREGRVASPLVRRRHYYLSHGIGRSGDVTSDQPKAAGSSLLARLTNCMALDIVRLAGSTVTTQAAVVVPMATGMSLALVLRAIAAQREEEDNMKEVDGDSEIARRLRRLQYKAPRVVIWPRVDQKTALKCIDAAGLVPWPVELRPARMQHHQITTTTITSAAVNDKNESKESHLQGALHDRLHETQTSSTSSDEYHPYYVQVDPSDVDAAIAAAGGRSNVLCVLSTTSCFAPRLPDDTVALARLCARHNIPYVVNNAYGLQSRSIMTRLDAAQREGRVDYVVQSTDKNFLVPVGGSVITSCEAQRVRRVAALYAGRASITPSLDLFFTFLTLGRQGFHHLWHTRYVCLQKLMAALDAFAQARQEQLITESMDTADSLTALAAMTTTSDKQNEANRNNTGAQTDNAKQQKQPKRRLPRNDISLAVTMTHYGTVAEAQALGARLFRSGVTGPRVIVPDVNRTVNIAGCSFHSYGTHQNNPPCAMLVMACGVGMTEEEVSKVMRRLERLWPVRT